MRPPADDEPLSHISRRSPPWRAPVKTECGKPLGSTKNVTRAEAQTLINKYGQKRATFMLCVTCVQTSDRYRDWETSPTDVIAREGTTRYGGGEQSEMDRELYAIAALIEAHREEFDGYLTDLAGTVSLRDRRAAKQQAQPPKIWRS